MYRVALITLTLLSLTVSIQGVRRNVTTKTEDVEGIEKTGEFDLSRLGELNDTEFKRMYFKIINAMKRIGPESLRYMNRTNELEVGFEQDSKETADDYRQRWQEFCDFYKLDGNFNHFKSLVMERVYKPPPPRVKKPPTHLRTLLETEDAVAVKKKK